MTNYNTCHRLSSFFLKLCVLGIEVPRRREIEIDILDLARDDLPPRSELWCDEGYRLLQSSRTQQGRIGGGTTGASAGRPVSSRTAPCTSHRRDTTTRRCRRRRRHHLTGKTSGPHRRAQRGRSPPPPPSPGRTRKGRLDDLRSNRSCSRPYPRCDRA